MNDLQELFGGLQVDFGNAKHAIERESAQVQVYVNAQGDYVVKTYLKKLKEFDLQYLWSYINTIRHNFPEAMLDLSSMDFNALYRANEVPHNDFDRLETDDEATEEEVEGEWVEQERKGKRANR